MNFLAPPKGIFGEVQEGVHLVWNIFGMIGAILFASRFWIQWLQAEKNQYSFFSTYFWVISLIGSSLCLLYFIHILDWVSVANYSFGIIPYIRNLFLIRRERLSEMTEQNRLG
ncbi:MAG: hypothetical protein S4CHLAM123_06430 [Chlamydiales bacterium]|nr:hypothetical protein [Chlamydiales bacterium]